MESDVKPKKLRLKIAKVSARVMFLLLLMFAVSSMPMLSDMPSSIAHADDDGDDGGDDDGGGSDDDGNDDDGDDDGPDGGDPGRGGSGGSSTSSGGGSGENFFQRLINRGKGQPTRRAQNQRRASPPARLPDFAEAEIVAIGLTNANITALEALNYEVVQRDQISVLNAFVTRLRVPQGTPLADARQEVQSLQPAGEVDFNHFFRPGGADACAEAWCRAPSMVDWPQEQGVADQCAAGVKIGLIDTGINPDHSALRDSRLKLIRTSEPDLRASSRQHGTAVASILVGSPDSRSPGLLPGAELVAIDAFYRAGKRDQRSDAYTLVRSLDMLAQDEVKVVNLSLSGPANTLLQNMIRNLQQRNMLIVSAVGNGGPKAKALFPAAYDGVFAVTAIDQNRRIYRRAVRGTHVDFSAPGVNVWAAASVKGARTKTGTSFATPFVTAMLAMELGRIDKNLTYQQAKEALIERAEDLGKPGFDPIFGHGLVRATGLCE